MSLKVSGVTVDVTEAQLVSADKAAAWDRHTLRVELTEDQLRSVLAQMLADSRYNKQFDVKLASGLLAELEFARMAELKFEVKHDPMGAETGSMALEFECNGKPSGIEATTADVWVHRFSETGPFVMFHVERLRDTARQFREAHPHRVKNGGDGMRAKVVLMPWQWLVGMGVRDE